MGTQENKAKDRLKQLMEQKGISNSQLAELCSVSVDSIKNYKRGGYRDGLPLDVAIKIADKYRVTLDWLFGRSEYQSETDLMADVVLALDNVFRFTARKDAAGDMQPVLLIDRQFYAYINDLQKLQSLKAASSMIESEYTNARREIYSKYHELFRGMFNVQGFNENAAIEIHDFEGLTIVDILGNATEYKKEPPK